MAFEEGTSKIAQRGDYAALKWGAAAVALFWTVVIALSFAWSLSRERREEMNIAVYQGRAAFSRDIAFRRWNAMHGGVYTRATDKFPPNPYLDVPEKVIKTPSGKTLTLTNPAYMMRQLYEMEKSSDEMPMGHITSLNLLNPRNKPDAWERAALLEFEKGGKEKSESVTEDGKMYMRYMRVLEVEDACMKCHAAQGYRPGDVRGGISIKVPMAPVMRAAHPHIVNIYAAHALLLLLGYAGIFASFVLLRRRASDRDAAVSELAESRRELQSLMDNLPGIAFKCRNDERRTMEFMSSGCRELTGYDSGDFIGGGVEYAGIIEAGCRGAVREGVQAAIDAKTPYIIEYRITTAGGAQKWVMEQGRGVYGGGGELLFVEGIIIDTTAKKAAEQAVEEVSNFNRNIVRGVAEGVAVCDRERRFMLWNPFMEKLTGMGEGEVLGRRVSEVIPGAAGVAWESLMTLALEGETAGSGDTAFEVGNDVRWVYVTFSPFRGADGEIAGALAVVSDITGRKINEIALRESEKRYRTFVSKFPGIAFRTKMDLTPVFYHGAVESMTGYSERDFISGRVSWVNVIHPEDLASSRDGMENIVTMAGNTAEREYRILRKDGGTMWVREQVQIVYDDEGEPEFIQGTVYDITERKSAESEIIESERRYRLLAEAMPDVMYITGRDGVVTYSNRKNLPYDPVGRGQDELFPPGVAETHIERIRRVFEKGEPISEVETLPSPLGGIVLENRYVPMKSAAGDVTSALVITRDVTVAHKTESMLKTMLRCSFGDDITGFMQSLVRNIAEALNVKYVFIARIAEGGKTLEAFAFWDGMKFMPGMVYNISGTPCERVMGDGTDAFTERVMSVFPGCRDLAALGAECYLGAPLVDSAGNVWGVIAALDDKPFPRALVPNATSMLEIMAARTTSEYERHLAIEDLKRSEARLRALSRNMIFMREEDRRTLARELHDELGQKLAALYLEIECLKTMPHAAESFVDAAKGILKNANDDLKRIYHRLRPIIIDKLGLGYAIEALLREYRERSEIEIEGRIAEFDKNEIDSERAIAAYRIMQEILTNAAKHSGAGKIRVAAYRDGRLLKMEVSDDGEGFDYGALREGAGFGIMGMKERAEIYNGRLVVVSSPGEGTKITVEIPVSDTGDAEGG